MTCTCCGRNRWRASVYQAPQRSSYIYPRRHYQHHRRAPMATMLRARCTWDTQTGPQCGTGGFTRIRAFNGGACVSPGSPRGTTAERQHTHFASTSKKRDHHFPPRSPCHMSALNVIGSPFKGFACSIVTVSSTTRARRSNFFYFFYFFCFHVFSRNRERTKNFCYWQRVIFFSRAREYLSTLLRFRLERIESCDSESADPVVAQICYWFFVF